ncbi:hypothetical protein OE88DRAFT_627480 [Heliocybe sulcata]|uniref:Oxidase ustYa n=1 Tax=Heliocybe sulcata TaxID=5364 RepID=A0A5C3NPB2_9AGAM|nr:hypothetical protein OE88DRAFT_627480 [Heliocybe sulcata]
MKYILVGMLVLFVASTTFSIKLHWGTAVTAPVGQLAASDMHGSFEYELANTWVIAPLDPVFMAHEDSVHYDVDTPAGIAEWNATLPSGGAVVHLGQSFRPFTLSLFHQLRCLNIVRDWLTSGRPGGALEEERPKADLPLARHCMNYLRQMVLCRADLTLEPVRSPTGAARTVSEVLHKCHDWAPIYEEAERNYAEYQTAVLSPEA